MVVAKIRAGKFVSGTGRRKTAVARVFLFDGKGKATVNDLSVDKYFSDLSGRRDDWKRPFNILDIKNPEDIYTVSVKVHGSGKSSQMGAIVHGISWALANSNEEYATVLRKNGMLTRDSRMVERKKYWLRKARKAPQYSKR